MPFKWDKSWEIGLEEIDAQHRQLVDIINELGEAMKSRKTIDVIGNVLKELEDYTRKHFAFEEALMRRYGYEGLDAHKPLHVKFVSQLREFRNEAAGGSISIGVKMYNFLGDWLRGHIRGTDTQYAEVIKAKGAK
ncbi:MAG: bacteriohemerythrin [Deltaproteobacteria bacterium]|nr:bacteriohemerythrin [Deltaproteobacteria bacterium]